VPPADSRDSQDLATEQLLLTQLVL